MDLDNSVPGEVNITMVDYLKEVIMGFPKEITGRAAILEAEHILKVMPEGRCVPLDEGHDEAFHQAIIQLLVACVRTGRDIQLPIAFLSTRVRTPNEDDQGKLKRLLNYIRGSVCLTLILRVEDLSVLKW